MKSALKSMRGAALAALVVTSGAIAAHGADLTPPPSPPASPFTPMTTPKKFLDEVRIGVSGSIQSSNTFESGAFPSATLFFDPFDRANAQTWTEIFLRPRIHAGAIISTDGNADQVFAGFTWTVDVTDKIFVDASFGGAWNNANDTNFGRGPHVGCNVLFHEALGLGYKITDNWRVLATVEHSSNADLCDANDGLSYAGIAVGYKF